MLTKQWRTEETCLADTFFFGSYDYHDNNLKCRTDHESLVRLNLNEYYVEEMINIINEFEPIDFLGRFEECFENPKMFTDLKDDIIDKVKNSKVHKSQKYLKLWSDMH